MTAGKSPNTYYSAEEKEKWARLNKHITCSFCGGYITVDSQGYNRCASCGANYQLSRQSPTDQSGQ
jgi:transcription elongation factor Elf1